MALVAVICGDELRANLISLGGAEAGVEAEGFLPVAAGPIWVVGDMVGAGQAVVCAGLLVPVAELAGQAEGGGVLDAGVFGLASGDEDFTEPVERVGLNRPVAVLAGHGQGFPEMAGCMLVAVLPQFGKAEVAQHVG